MHPPSRWKQAPEAESPVSQKTKLTDCRAGGAGPGPQQLSGRALKPRPALTSTKDGCHQNTTEWDCPIRAYTHARMGIQRHTHSEPAPTSSPARQAGPTLKPLEAPKLKGKALKPLEALTFKVSSDLRILVA